jgi:arylsulfatase A-like enzyme
MNNDKVAEGLNQDQLTKIWTEAAVEYIHSAKEKPFFLYVAHNMPHVPWHASEKFRGSSEKGLYGDIMQEIDWSMGEIIKALKDKKTESNTIILFTSDNGQKAKKNGGSAGPLRGSKAQTWEGGMRVPFIASWATPQKSHKLQQELAIPQHSIQSQMGTIFDVFSTVCELANTKPPKGHITDGITLHKQLEGKRNKKHPQIFLNHFPHAHRSNYFSSIVIDEWKVIYHYQVDGSPRYELFNLEKDPFEATDLANANPKQLKKMMKLLVKELQDNKALYPEKEGKELGVIMPI